MINPHLTAENVEQISDPAAAASCDSTVNRFTHSLRQEVNLSEHTVTPDTCSE